MVDRTDEFWASIKVVDQGRKNQRSVSEIERVGQRIHDALDVEERACLETHLIALCRQQAGRHRRASWRYWLGAGDADAARHFDAIAESIMLDRERTAVETIAAEETEQSAQVEQRLVQINGQLGVIGTLYDTMHRVLQRSERQIDRLEHGIDQVEVRVERSRDALFRAHDARHWSEAMPSMRTWCCYALPFVVFWSLLASAFVLTATE